MSNSENSTSESVQLRRFERAALAITTLQMCMRQSRFSNPDAKTTTDAGERFSVAWDSLTTEEKIDFGKWYTAHQETFFFFPIWHTKDDGYVPARFTVLKQFKDLTDFEILFMMLYLKYTTQYPKNGITDQHLDEVKEKIKHLRDTAASIAATGNNEVVLSDNVPFSETELLAIRVEMANMTGSFRFWWQRVTTGEFDPLKFF